MQLVKSDIHFCIEICTWLSDNQNFIDCGGKSGATWFEVFNKVSQFWEIGIVYKVIGETKSIGFAVIEGDHFHTFLIPENRNAHNAYTLMKLIYFLMFDLLNKKEIYSMSLSERTSKYLLWKGFTKQAKKRFNLDTFKYSKRSYLKCQ